MASRGQRRSSLRERGRGSLLGVPVAFVGGALGLSVVTVVADEVLSGVVPEAVLFRGDVDSARSMLTSIASSTITLTGLVFSVTMLVLQLTAAQYSPRAVGALLTDKNSKFTLGVFVGTFTYSLAILRTIAPDGVEFDRGISVAVAVVLALLTVGFFIQYVNHVAHQIRPTSIIGRVSQAAGETIDAELPDEPQPPVPPAPTVEPDRVVHASEQGVVRSVDTERLLARAADHDLRIHVVPRVGEFVPEGGELLQVWGQVREDLEDGLDHHVELGAERSMTGDRMYGFRQLVDIAERALSPGTNDPTTAVQAVDQIHHLLRRVVHRPFPAGVHTDDDGRIRVVVPENSWQDVLDLAVDEIAHYGEDSLQIRARLAAMLHDLATIAPPERLRSIADKVVAVDRGAPSTSA